MGSLHSWFPLQQCHYSPLPLLGGRVLVSGGSVWQYQVLVLCFGDFDSYPKMMFVNAFIYLHSELIQRSVKDWFFEGPESTVSLKTGELVAWGTTWWIYRWVSLPKLIAYCVRFELVESSTSKNTTYLLYIEDYTTVIAISHCKDPYKNQSGFNGMP